MKLLEQFFLSRRNSIYICALKKPIQDNLFFIECKEDITRAIKAFIIETLKQNPKIDFYICLSDSNPSMQKHFADMGIHLHYVHKNSALYYKILAYAKYLYTDGLFPDYFVKRKEQICTVYASVPPVEIDDKDLGSPIHYSLFNHSSKTQNNLLQSDFILCDNTKTKDQVSAFYFLDPLFQGNYLIKENLTLDMIIDTLFTFNSFYSNREGVNKKENILIFCSDLRRNGMTTSLLNLLSLLDLKKENYIMTYQEDLFSEYPERLAALPEGVCLLPLNGTIAKKSVWDTIVHALYFRFDMNAKWIYKRVFRMYHRAFTQYYGMVEIQNAIHFTGYSPEFALLFMTTDIKRMIFVHNDMYEEYEQKKNFHMPSLLHAYTHYDCIACVSDAVKNSLNKLNISSEKAVVLENAHDHMGVIKKATLPFSLDSDTFLSIPMDEFETLLQSKKKKFITIGRFSKEKGHIKLMDAFSRYHKDHLDTILIIIGGYGDYFNDTLHYKNQLPCKDNIIIIKSIINPFAIIKHCDLFILPSDREPLGLVLLEADSLDLPIIATDIPGSGDFMKQHGGYLTENSVEGLIQGMKDFSAGKVKPLSIDYEKYNMRIVEQFEQLLD